MSDLEYVKRHVDSLTPLEQVGIVATLIMCAVDWSETGQGFSWWDDAYCFYRRFRDSNKLVDEFTTLSNNEDDMARLLVYVLNRPALQNGDYPNVKEMLHDLQKILDKESPTKPVIYV